MIAKQSNLTAITSLKSFKPYWNGYSGRTFGAELCEFAEQVINAFGDKLQPKLFPTGTGHIQLEFETDNTYIEIELTGNHSADFYTETITETDVYTNEQTKDSCQALDIVEFVMSYM